MGAKSKMIFLILGMILNINFGYAQKSKKGFSFGIKNGINMSSLVTEKSLFEGNENAISKKFGYVGGIFVEYKFTKCFYLSGDLFYSRKGFNVELPVVGNALIDTRVQLNYLDIPIMSNFYVYKGLVLKVGLQSSILLSSKFQVKRVSVSVFESFRHFDYSMPVGIAYDFENGLILDLRYSLGVNAVLKSQERGELNNNSVSHLWSVLDSKIIRFNLNILKL